MTPALVVPVPGDGVGAGLPAVVAVVCELVDGADTLVEPLHPCATMAVASSQRMHVLRAGRRRPV